MCVGLAFVSRELNSLFPVTNTPNLTKISHEIECTLPAEREPWKQSRWNAVLREPGSNCASKTHNRYWRLRKPLHHSRQRFRKIVVYHHGGEQYEKHKRGLINPFFDLQADVAANDALDEKEQDHTTIEYRNGQEIENAEIEADC